ncbi:FAD-dependent oxidoreductase [Devosia sp. A8/3-2]|nr:FAD-dependent oxidoreductase [Devosia sp. A8/3-2]
MADLQNPDICIIGAGALGIALALQAKRLGASVLLVDRGAEEPGDPAQGRSVAATFAASAARAQDMRTAGALGLAHAEPKPNFKAIGEHAKALAASTAPRDASERLIALGIDYRTGQPVFTGRQTLKIGDATLRPRHIIVTTGAKPILPPIPGLDEIAYFTPDTIAGNNRKLSHLVVIGGDSSAIELAQAYHRLGATVTLVPQGEILPGFDREQVAVLLRQLVREGLEIAEGAMVSAILPRRQGTGIDVTHADGSTHSLDASHVLVAMGRLPDLAGLGLDRAKALRQGAARLSPAQPGWAEPPIPASAPSAARRDKTSPMPPCATAPSSSIACLALARAGSTANPFPALSRPSRVWLLSALLKASGRCRRAPWCCAPALPKTIWRGLWAEPMARPS